MTDTFVESGDRQSLLKLLETRFPDTLYPNAPIEYEIALNFGGGRSADPILLFGEAYSKCHDEAARHHLLIVVRRASSAHGFVARTMPSL